MLTPTAYLCQMTQRKTKRSYSTLFLLMLIVSAAVVLSTYIFTHLLIQNRRAQVIEKADARLLIAAEMLNKLLGSDYHDTITDGSSLSPEDFQFIVDRNDALCRRLDLQYLWSVLVMGDTIVFTSATRTDVFDPESAHASFFEVHRDPQAFDPALASDGQAVFSTFRNEWGKGRMVLLPYEDIRGRTYIIGASVQLLELRAMVRQTAMVTAGLGLLVIATVWILAYYLAKRLTTPISNLTFAAERMASGDLDVPLVPSGSREMQSLARSLDSMRQGLNTRISQLQSGKKREEGENAILTRISKREPLDRILEDIALFCERLDTRIRASILLFDKQTEKLYHAAAPSLPDEYNDLLKPGLPVGPDVGSCGSSAYHRQRVSVANIAEDPRWLPYTDYIRVTDKYGLKACWSQPFFSSDGRLLGTIANYSSQAGLPTEENIRALEWSTRIAGLAVEQDMAEKELISAKTIAEQNDKLKTTFLQNMSHEIRTPLNGITGFCSLLKNHEKLSHKQRNDYLEIVLSSSNRLLAVVDDVLKISQIESGLLKPRLSVFRLGEVVAYFKHLFAASADTRGLVFETKIYDGLAGLKVRTDKDKLYQILSNFLANAMKFTHQGVVELFVKREEGGFSFNVRDTGIGIERKYHQAMFDRFWQKEAFTEDFYGGTGLGLSISMGLAELLGYRIRVESQPGSGSTFSLDLPESVFYGVEEQSEEETTNASPGHQLLENKRVLIAEDDKVSYLYLSELLASEGAYHTWVTNGRQAIEQVEKEHFDLVIMDLKMPVMDGLEATRQIKDIKPDLFVLVQSAYALPEDEEMALKAGADAFVGKPFQKEDALRIINRSGQPG